jgi:hypothetical protein
MDTTRHGLPDRILLTTASFGRPPAGHVVYAVNRLIDEHNEFLIHARGASMHVKDAMEEKQRLSL